MLSLSLRTLPGEWGRKWLLRILLHWGLLRRKWVVQGADHIGRRSAPGQVRGEQSSSCVEAAPPPSGVHSHLHPLSSHCGLALATPTPAPVPTSTS